MNSTHEECKERLNNYLTGISSNRAALKTEGSIRAVSERLRREQIDLIICQLNDDAIQEINDPTLKRAINTLKQICG